MEKRFTESQSIKLLELLQSAKKALELANKYQQDGTIACERCKISCSKLETIHNTVENMCKSITQHLQNTGQVVMEIRSRNSHMVSTLERLQNNHGEISSGLTSIFKKLTEKQVDANIAAKTTLYDYVDTESVAALKDQAYQELSALQNIQSSVQQIVTAVEQKYSQALGFKRPVNVDYKSSYAQEKMGLVSNELNAISAIVLSIATIHDRIQHYHHREAGIDLIAMEKSLDTSTQLSKISDSVQRINQIHQDILAKIEKHNAVFTQALTFLRDIEKFGQEVQLQIMQLNTLEMNFNGRHETVKNFFEELSNLATWYDLFYTAYEELIHEIVRRHREHQRQQETVEAYQRELEIMTKREIQMRDHFYEFYGRYLPPSLVPAIEEAPPHYQIFPEHFQTQLPLVTEIERPSQSHIDLELSSLQLTEERH